MRNGMALRITLILAIVVGINGYIGWHLKVFLSHLLGASFQPVVYWIVFWLVALSYLLAWFGSRVLPPSVSRLFKIIGSYWFALIQFGMILLPLTDVAIGCASLRIRLASDLCADSWLDRRSHCTYCTHIRLLSGTDTDHPQV